MARVQAIDERLQRTVMVYDITPTLTRDDIHIHFQKRKSGGGDCDIYPGPRGKYLVVFDDKSVADHIVAVKTHQIGTCTVSVRRMFPEIFPKVTAQVNKKIFEATDVQGEDFERTIADLRRRGLPPPHIQGDTISFTGTWRQMQTFKNEIESLIEEREKLYYRSTASEEDENKTSHPEDIELSEDLTRHDDESVTSHLADKSSDVTDHQTEPFRMQSFNHREENQLALSQEDNFTASHQDSVMSRYGSFETNQYNLETRKPDANIQVSVSHETSTNKISIRTGSDTESSDEETSYEDTDDVYKDNGKTNLKTLTLDISSSTLNRGKIATILKNFAEAFPDAAINMDKNTLIVSAQSEVAEDVMLQIRETLGVLGAKPKAKSSMISRVQQAITGRQELKTKLPVTIQTDIPHTLNSYAHFRFEQSGLDVYLYRHDITRLGVSCIVNAANENLRHGGGIAKAIRKAAGPPLVKECDEYVQKYGRLKTTQVLITGAGNLAAQKVMHAVGPRWENYYKRSARECENDLRITFTNCLITCKRCEFHHVAIPAISSGIFGVPLKHVVQALCDALVDFVLHESGIKPLKAVHLVNIDDNVISEIFKALNTLAQNYPDLKCVALKGIGFPGQNDDVVQPHIGSDKHAHRHKGGHDDVRRPDRSNLTDKLPATEDTSQQTPEGASSNSVCRNVGTVPFNKYVQDKDKDTNDNKPGSIDGEKEECPICMSEIEQVKILGKCKHAFCKSCIDRAFEFNNSCPVCKTRYGVTAGNQPQGATMSDKIIQDRLPGYHCSTIVIDYHVPDGYQRAEHPNPGRRYRGTSRTAYLPNNSEGGQVLKLLRQAFDARLIFTVGMSVTTGVENVVTWNDIHHKTNMHGGSSRFGYPDADYLRRVKEELAAKGIA